MKKLFLFAIAVLLVCGCTDSGIDETPYGGSDNTENPGDGNDSEDEKPDIPEYSINGSVQKGQFIQGSVVTIQELNERLQPVKVTKRRFSTTWARSNLHRILTAAT